MDFLGNNSLRIVRITDPKIINNVIFSQPNNIDAIKLQEKGVIIEPPDIIVISLYDNDTSNILYNAKSSVKNKPLDFTLVSPTHKIKYVLDSVIIRDTSKSHFVSVLTCNGNEKTFDGASISRLSNLKWKSLLNENQEWTYKYNKPGYSDMRWNFCEGYQLMFYYRSN